MSSVLIYHVENNKSKEKTSQKMRRRVQTFDWYCIRTCYGLWTTMPGVNGRHICSNEINNGGVWPSIIFISYKLTLAPKTRGIQVICSVAGWPSGQHRTPYVFLSIRHKVTHLVVFGINETYFFC